MRYRPDPVNNSADLGACEPPEERSVEAEPLELVLVEAEEVPDLMEEGHPDLLDELLPVPRVALQVPLEEADGRGEVAPRIHGGLVPERRAPEDPQDGRGMGRVGHAEFLRIGEVLHGDGDVREVAPD